MGIKFNILKSIPTAIEVSLEEQGVTKAMNSPIVFRTKKEKGLLLFMIATTMLAILFIIVQAIRMII